jgi:hypothetical protein
LNATLAQEGGVTFVGRYISQQATSPMDKREAAYWASVGMPLVAIWETSFLRPVEGGSDAQNYANGQVDAQAAAKVMGQLGAPSTAPVYFACDDFVQPEDPSRWPPSRVIASFSDIVPYYKGLRSVLGDQAGAYGSYTTISGLFDAGLIKFGWQATSFDSDGRLDPRAQLVQYDTTPSNSFGVGQLDYDHATTDNFGQWHSSL